MNNITPADERIKLALDELMVVQGKLVDALKKRKNPISLLGKLSKHVENVIDMLENGY